MKHQVDDLRRGLVEPKIRSTSCTVGVTVELLKYCALFESECTDFVNKVNVPVAQIDSR